MTARLQDYNRTMSPQPPGKAASSATQSTYATRARLWRWSGGKTSWYFLTLPAAISRQIRLVDAGPRRTGFGALRVQATIGATIWQTSIFPSAELKAYILPVKASVRKAESMQEGKSASVQIVVRRAG
jgi:hypothetical protein